MAISFVGAGTVATGINSTVDVPAGVQAGDALLIVTCGTATPTTPTGWTSIYAQGTGRYITVLLKIATASESSVNLTQAGTASKTVMLAYRGTSYFDVVGTIATATSTSISTNTLTTRFNNDYVVSIYASTTSASTITWTAPGSTTTRVNSGSIAGQAQSGLLIVDELDAVAGVTTARTATSSLTLALAAIAISFKEPQTFYVDPENGADANSGLSFGAAFKNISGATSAKGVQAGDTVRVKEAPLYNTGVNATWTSVTERGTSPFLQMNFSSTTNATPIVCTTTTAHGYSTGDVVQIGGVSTNTAANGIWKITVTGSNTFSLDDSSGNGVGSGGGVAPIFCRTIKTASALVQPIASFAPLKTVSLGTRAAWTGSTNVTTALTATFGKGAYYDTITILSAFTTGKIAYYTLPATLNLSSYQQISLFIQQSSGTTLGGLTISLCSDTLGNTAVDTFTIPSTRATGIWCPFTIDKGSALGASIQSISISRAANNGAQTFLFNSIVAVKSPTSVDALSNTSLVAKNNTPDGAFAVGGFGGSDGTIVFLDNSPSSNNNATTSGAYYGTTETTTLYRFEPFNPFTLNGALLPATTTAANTYCAVPVNSGILNNHITFSGGWDATNMSTRTGQTWFSNQNGFGYGIVCDPSYVTLDRLNYLRALNGWFKSSSVTNSIIQNCNYTATRSSGMDITNGGTVGIEIQNCIISSNASSGIQIDYGSSDANRPIIINNCIISGNITYNLSFNGAPSNTDVYCNITNNSFNTSSSTGMYFPGPIYGAITNNSINYFNTTGIQFISNPMGTFSDLTLVPEPAGGTNIFNTTGSTTLPQNIYSTFTNVVVNAPTTAYSVGTTTVTNLFNGCSNFKFLNGDFSATNVSYTQNILSPQGGQYLYNCLGVPTAILADTTFEPKPYVLNSATYSQDEDNTVGNNKIYFQGGLATSQTAVRHTASGYAWSMAPTSTTATTATYPMKLKVASIAANSGSAVTISAWMQRSNTGLTMQLVCPGGQPYGPSSDTVASMTAVANTWEQVSISFTPTQNAVFDIYAYAYGGTTFTGYVDDLEVSQ